MHYTWLGKWSPKTFFINVIKLLPHPTLSALKSKDGFLVVICKNIQGGGETGGLLGDEEAYLMETEEHWASLLPALFRPV